MIDLKITSDVAAPAIPFRVRLEPYLIESLCELARVLREKGTTQTDVSGLLYGTAESGSRVVAALKTFGDAGPRSDLARRERLEKAYIAAVEEANEDPELSSLELIGWFSFRNGSGLLSNDVIFHNQHFRKPEDLALVIWRDGATQITTEIYSRSGPIPMTSTDYRWSSVRLSSEIRHMNEPIDLAMRVKLSDDSFLRAYDSDDVETQFDSWKQRAGATFGRLMSFLQLRQKEPKQAARVRGLISDGQPQQHVGWDLPDSGPAVGPEAPAYEAPLYRDDWRRSDFPAPAHRMAAEVPPYREPEPIRPVAAAAAAGAVLGVPRTPEPQRVAEAWPSSGYPPSGYPPVPVLDLGRIGQTPQQRYRAAHIHAEVSGLPMVIRPVRKKQLPWGWFAAIFVLFSVAVFAVFAFGLQGGGRFSTAVRSVFSGGELNLRVRSEDDRLRLTWNAQNPAVSSATDGTLQILDGATRRNIHLEGRQVMDGSVLYRPLTSDVTFRLEVHGEQGSTLGSVRVLDGPQNPQSSPVLDVSDPLGNPQPGDQIGLLPAQTAGGDNGAQTYSDRSSFGNSPASSRRGGGGSDALAVSVPTSSGPSTTRAANSSRSPAIQTATSTPETSSTVSPSANSSEGSAASERSTNTTASSDPVSNTRPSQALTSSGARSPAYAGTSTINGWEPAAPEPARGGRTTPAANVSDFVGPQALVKAAPDTKGIGNGTVKSLTRVEVQVRVDQTGRVTSAHLLNSGFKRSVANAALNAARKWTFQPATLRGQRVESDHTIVFEFRPQR